ncbi:MAG: nickel pincer cofactor biosynthesis protein LarC [Candidatus Krumholzibacteria bacterium]|nr:nickel pincer cofactor biosynthesis protein LarC [Candidatus Krumholzibacteria bacterium]
MAGRQSERWDTIVFDPAAGLSGDMFLGCLFALGADPREVARRVATMPGLERFRIVAGRVRRRGLAAVRVRVECAHAHHARDLRSILSMIRRSGLDGPVKDSASAVFAALGEAEGRVHGIAPAKVHFHEVGAVDSIVDIVGSVVALSLLGFPRLYHRPLRLGGGTITFSHGTLPLPAPATIEVLAGRTVTFGGGEGEIVTPTGAALARVLAEELPAGMPLRPARTVYAAGTRESGAEPGMLRAVACSAPHPGAPAERRVTVLSAAMDDMSPELFGHVQQRLFAEGALDVLMSPVSMKKNRPGVLLTVLCRGEDALGLAGVVFAETTTIGLRIAEEGRLELDRAAAEAQTPYGPIMVKYARLPDGSLKAAPEFESCLKAARAAGAPLRLVYEAAAAASGTAPARWKARGRGKGGARR